ncbi:hypothetical protein A3G50_02945 [Candidatus Jorgensenbacteria bacterium RIFCSPLOWO2_12_FULL_42_11]|uniref:Uncharacterized protein n=1 Tax=Candidatus Jorgensenbacteria bacterium RIFCSPLOWO2_12_FULL_42_11 TaxID=1798473 RepID=A0A1F6C178_9BACT|nr:MAG: hypothetical protein A3G50_02945 [Candidatus Jorgensenbacteria bacterium RIFCSPLOWO2_12_FULL_42_11]
MALRDRIDLALSFGLLLEPAVTVMFKMGKESGIAEEMGISQLNKEEIRILARAGLLTRQELKKYLKGDVKHLKEILPTAAKKPERKNQG